MPQFCCWPLQNPKPASAMGGMGGMGAMPGMAGMAALGPMAMGGMGAMPGMAGMPMAGMGYGERPAAPAALPVLLQTRQLRGVGACMLCCCEAFCLLLWYLLPSCCGCALA